ncbi:uncharacterized protein LOC128557280 [Mercenaria mercenaria]|uniref:uncharacterized protein LOC128557280 n=1 Tax=Mercenaria mercenaria TaxID=6596 RepID=UPI00234E6563|nr:uncharacterized protein LOC128557280 [Mercenaria mercenaria]
MVNDIFTYKVPLERKPYTKRRVLSTINGLFDPLGFVAPVVLGGRLIMKQALQDQNLDWDDPLSENLRKDWISWQDSLAQLEELEIPPTFTDLSFDNSARRELHVFSDASKEAISAVTYLRTVDSDGNSQIVEHTYYYTDSQVVLGYINNTSRRFYVYVGNRVDKILKLSSRAQWNFVPTEKNPADHGTRPVKKESMKDCKWLQGPEISDSNVSDDKCNDFELIDPEQDSEVRPVIEVKKVEVERSNLGCHRIERFPSWSRLVAAMSCLKRKSASCYKDSQKERNTSNVEFKVDAEETILKEVQEEVYSSEIECLQKSKPVQRNSSLVNLSPMLASKGLLRVGGRLNNASLDTGEKTPVIIPGKSHIAILLVRHHHEKVAHQGRHLTEGAVRSAGFWITGRKRLNNSIRCRRLRRPIETQKMSDLPPCRVTASAPFTYVGVDTFGPWSILTRKTRGGANNSNRWAILFSCLYTRAVHVEVVEDMSASCFINALRRLIAFLGPVKEFYSDRETNFVGAASELGIDKICVEDLHIFLEQQGLWYFNTPHSSHMNGAWERMIGLARRILESLLWDSKHLTPEVLCTLMAEVVCIINSRPITTVSDDPTLPTILSPNILLTHK